VAKNLDSRFWAALVLVVLAALIRLLPHPPNFSPINAMALFAGASLMRRSWMIVLPLAALFLSDLALGFHDQMIPVYLTVALISVLGMGLGEKPSWLRLGSASVASALIFFAITNFSVWLTSGMYPLTLTGLSACFTLALPFLENAIAGDIFFSFALFGAWAFYERRAGVAVRG
jgi:hypothetical protein